MTNGKYILRGREPVEVFDLMEWASAFGRDNRIVRQSRIGRAFISTVFLGIDHNFSCYRSRPVLFETMIFDEPLLPDYQTRCSTWDEAEADHKLACMIVDRKQSEFWHGIINLIACVAIIGLIAWWML
jgi:hypothetical protein